MTNEEILGHSFFIGRVECVEKRNALKAMDAAREDERESIKACTGCGWLSFDKIPPPHLACCPDNNYVPLREFVLKISPFTKL